MIKVTANLMTILFICPGKYNNEIYLEDLNAKLFIPCEKESGSISWSSRPFHKISCYADLGWVKFFQNLQNKQPVLSSMQLLIFYFTH